MRTFVVPLLLGAALVAPGAAQAELIYGLFASGTTTSLASFDSAMPNFRDPIALTGLAGGAGEEVVGIDFRPADGALVALTRQQSGTNVGRGRVYTIDTATGAATLINGQLTNAVTGTEVLLSAGGYGIDFNPVSNALRVVGAADQNLRIVEGGAGLTNVDTPLNGPGGANPSISAIAYDNNVAGAPTTTLYALDQGPSPGRLRTIGSIDGTPTSPDSGTVFDVGPLTISSREAARALDISGSTGIAYALFGPGPGPPIPVATITLSTVNLSTGQTTVLGDFLKIEGAPLDIAVALASVGPAPVPEPAGLALLAVGAAGLAGYSWKRRKRAAAA